MEERERDAQYQQAVAEYGQALARLARAYESNADQQRDLLQDVHFALWRSFAAFNGQCSLRTWTYRVAHNVVISTRLRRRRRQPQLLGLDELELEANAEDVERASDERPTFRLRSIASWC